MARFFTTTVRLDEGDVRVLERAPAEEISASDLVRKGLRVVASQKSPRSRQRQRQACMIRCLIALVLAQATLLPSSAQTSAGPSRLERVDPKPEDAIQAILAAFSTYQVVGMNAAHHLKDQDDFILSLIRHPGLPTAVNDIVVECGNSLYQSTLDRYIAGEDVPVSEVRQVWRNTTQTMCSVSAFYEELFPLVRGVNQRLTPEKRLRMLAGDPPIDWHMVNSRAGAAYVEQFLDRRNTKLASLMEKEVFGKRRKALMLYGSGHLFHGIEENAVGLYENRHPGVTFVIFTHGSYGCDAPPPKEKRRTGGADGFVGGTLACANQGHLAGRHCSAHTAVSTPV